MTYAVIFRSTRALDDGLEYDHLLAQDLGREKFYQDYEVQVTEVLREYKWEKP